MLFSSAQNGMVQVNLYLGLLKGNSKDKGKISSWIIMVRCSVWELSIHGLIIGAKQHTGECQHATGGLLASYSVYPWPVLWALKQGTQVQKLLWVPAVLSNISVIPHPWHNQSGFANSQRLLIALLHVNQVWFQKRKSFSCPSKPVWLWSFLFVFGIKNKKME